MKNNYFKRMGYLLLVIVFSVAGGACALVGAVLFGVGLGILLLFGRICDWLHAIDPAGTAARTNNEADPD